MKFLYIFAFINFTSFIVLLVKDLNDINFISPYKIVTKAEKNEN